MNGWIGLADGDPTWTFNLVTFKKKVRVKVFWNLWLDDIELFNSAIVTKIVFQQYGLCGVSSP